MSVIIQTNVSRFSNGVGIVGTIGDDESFGGVGVEFVVVVSFDENITELSMNASRISKVK